MQDAYSAIFIFCFVSLSVSVSLSLALSFCLVRVLVTLCAGMQAMELAQAIADGKGSSKAEVPISHRC